jgi:hypothetical protein
MSLGWSSLPTTNAVKIDIVADGVLIRPLYVRDALLRIESYYPLTYALRDAQAVIAGFDELIAGKDSQIVALEALAKIEHDKAKADSLEATRKQWRGIVISGGAGLILGVILGVILAK